MNNQPNSPELTEKETQRNYHWKWFIIHLVTFMFFAVADAALPPVFIVRVIGKLFTIDYLIFWIYHLVRWLQVRKECQNLAVGLRVERVYLANLLKKRFRCLRF